MSNILTTSAILCRKCLDLIVDRETCKCNNVGIIIDEDGFQHVYVEDITTIHRAILYHIDGKEVRRELLKGFNEAIYADYSLLHTPLSSKTYAPKRYESRRTKTRYDENLIKQLERHYYRTSDGTERFQRNAT